MFFLLRTAFWLSLLLLVLPLGGGKSGDGPSATERASIDTMSALAAAGATVSDVGGFCARQPDACKVGSQALQVIGERAKTGADMIQDYLNKDTPKPSPMATGSASRASAVVPGARDTLNASDRKPAWRGAAGRQV